MAQKLDKNAYFKFPLEKSILCLRLENMYQDGRMNKKNYTVTIIGIVEKVLSIHCDYVRIKGKYYQSKIERVIIREENLYYDDYGQFKKWYVLYTPFIKRDTNYKIIDIKQKDLKGKDKWVEKMEDAFVKYKNQESHIRPCDEPLVFLKKSEKCAISPDLKCELCELPDKENEMILCSLCNKGYHISCLCDFYDDFDKEKVMDSHWFCDSCKYFEDIYDEKKEK